MNSDIRGPNRKPATTWNVLNPFWMLGDIERNRKWPAILWFLINSATNAKSVVFGIAHRTRTVYWANSPYTFADRGWNYGYSVAHESAIKLPFVSYRGLLSFGIWRGLEWKMGWETNGALSLFTLRIANSNNTADSPWRA